MYSLLVELKRSSGERNTYEVLQNYAAAMGLTGVCCSTVIRIFACSTAVFDVSVAPITRSCLLTLCDRPVRNWCNNNCSAVWLKSPASPDPAIVLAREHTGIVVLPDAIVCENRPTK